MQKPYPLGEKILVEPLEDDKKSVVLRPETEEKKRPCMGMVVEVGREYNKGEPGELQRGVIVYYQKFGPEEFVIDGKKYHCGNPEDFYIVIR